MKKNVSLIIGLLLSLFIAHLAQAEPVVGITSGDTLTILKDHKPLILRLAYIDAPVTRQPYYQASRKSLSMLCMNKNVVYEIIDSTANQHIAIVKCNGTNASHAQIKQGYAWVSEKNCRDDELMTLQKQAKEKQSGLWKQKYSVPPSKFRGKALH